MTPQKTRQPPRARQRGISLYVILIIVLLSMLLALWASRTALFNEMVVGNDADYQRAFEAAQAMLQDAEFDIRGEKPDGSGTACVPPQGSATVCRTETGQLHFPAEAADVDKLLDALDQYPVQCQAEQCPNFKCQNGLCQKFTGEQDFWNDAAVFKEMIKPGVGARYGQFTGATGGGANDSHAASASVSPILTDRSAGKGAWYWIEVLPFDSASANQAGQLIVNAGNQTMVPLHVVPAVAYRITAVAMGRKAGSRVVLQQTYVRQKLKD